MTKEAGGCKVRAADLASKAVQQEQKCTSTAQAIYAEKQRAQKQLCDVEKRVSFAHSRIRKVEQMKGLCEEREENRSQRIDKHRCVSVTQAFSKTS